MRSLLRVFLLVLIGPGAVQAAEPVPFYFEMVRLPDTEVWVARREVTQEQYREITGDHPSRFPGPNCPVENVSWDDATDFCQKLTAREHAAGRLPKDFVYDLPTDDQWDAFSAGTDLKDAATSIPAPRAAPEAVGSHAANPLGLYDVAGNVWEWCRDWYDNRIRKKDGNKDLPSALTDAEAVANGPEETFKVLRGGAWDTTAADGFTLASRLRYAPGMGNYHTGFRCVAVKRVTRQSVGL